VSFLSEAGVDVVELGLGTGLGPGQTWFWAQAAATTIKYNDTVTAIRFVIASP
jgi:hypothetical protein